MSIESKRAIRDPQIINSTMLHSRLDLVLALLSVLIGCF
jgi:hypothetical protein